MSTHFYYGDDHMTIADALALAHGEKQGSFSATCRTRVSASHAQVHNIVEGKKAVYGINTGFGPLV